MRLAHWIDRLVWDEAERRFRERASSRGRLTAKEFAEEFFSKHPYPSIPRAVARIAQRELGIHSLLPEDNLAHAFPDIDFEELVRDILEELNLPARGFDFASLDGSIADLVERLTMYIDDVHDGQTE